MAAAVATDAAAAAATAAAATTAATTAAAEVLRLGGCGKIFLNVLSENLKFQQKS